MMTTKERLLLKRVEFVEAHLEYESAICALMNRRWKEKYTKVWVSTALPLLQENLKDKKYICKALEREIFLLEQRGYFEAIGKKIPL